MLRIRTIQTNPDGTPALDAEGREIELTSIEIPIEVEAEGPAAIEAYVAERTAAPAVPDPAPEPEDVDAFGGAPTFPLIDEETAE